jgi:hypothetical protein
MKRIVPTTLNGAKVIYHTPIDHRHQATGNCRHTVAGELIGSASNLAICRYDGDGAFYLFYCDSDWNVVTDTWHKALEDAMHQAELEYQGVGATWLNVVLDGE